ncbi:Retrovirus-related Pol polyprotein from transposon 17.6 [Exaiptasia diaphana]|nr:Retrovirus-related Pol polyprotein from transposon 17.6 [Exaiptasia diaphana]
MKKVASNEEISRWILRVELYAASQGWDDKKTAGKAALNLPNDKLDVLLALSDDDRTSWKKIKKILVSEFQPSKENSEELFLNRVKKYGESYLVYSKHLERLYRESFGLASDVKLNEQSLEAIKRQFLRGITQEISQRLKLHNPADPLNLLVTRANEFEEILIRPNSVRSVNCDTRVSFEELQNEVKELKDMVAALSTTPSPNETTTLQTVLLATFKLNSVDVEGHTSTLNTASTTHKQTLHVGGHIGKTPCTWLVDTGADVTCVSAQLPGVNKLAVESTRSKPLAANGLHLNVVGETTASIKIGHPPVRILVVDKLNFPAILGLDVCRRYDNMAVDWKQQLLHLGGHQVSLENRFLGSPRQPTEVCLVSDTVIPPRSQCFVNAASKDFGALPQDTLFTPYQEKMARQDVLLGSGVVVRDSGNRIPVLVMNNSESPAKLYGGTSIGQLCTVLVEEKDENTWAPKPPLGRGPVNVDLHDSCLSLQEREKVQGLLSDFRDVFANNEFEVGHTDKVQFKINTGEQPPVAVKLRRTPFSLRNEVESQIRAMEERGVIRKSTSPWSSPILLVPKKDGRTGFVLTSEP